jgi:hypothetical protein
MFIQVSVRVRFRVKLGLLKLSWWHFLGVSLFFLGGGRAAAAGAARGATGAGMSRGAGLKYGTGCWDDDGPLG